MPSVVGTDFLGPGAAIKASAQMTVDVFWDQLQLLETNLRGDQSVLDLDKLRLQRQYTSARNDQNRQRGAARMTALQPAIHRNSQDRIDHQNAIAKYNAAVNAASKDLASAGLSAQTLSGLGVAPALIVVGVVAVAALGIAIAVWARNHDNIMSHQRDNDILIAHDKALAAVIASPSVSAADRSAAVRAMTAATAPLARQAATPPDTSPDPLGLKGILSSATPIIALVALMVLAPPIIEAAGSRGGK